MEGGRTESGFNSMRVLHDFRVDLGIAGVWLIKWTSEKVLDPGVNYAWDKDKRIARISLNGTETERAIWLTFAIKRIMTAALCSSGDGGGVEVEAHAPDPRPTQQHLGIPADLPRLSPSPAPEQLELVPPIPFRGDVD